MLRWAVVFFVIALISAIFGFSKVAAGAAGLAKVTFFVSLMMFLIFIIGGRMARRNIARKL